MDDREENTRHLQRHYSSNSKKSRPFSRNTVPHSRPISTNHFQDDDDIDDDEESLNYDELNDKDGGFYDHEGEEGTFEEEEEMGRFNFRQNEGLKRKPNKKRKLKNVMNYEFASRSGSSLPGGWSEQETFLLLEAWGNKYLGRGRKSLRSEDWNEVAERVSEASENERTDAECRNRLDTLKKKYKKEKGGIKQCGGGGSKWVYFRRMDMLLAEFQPREQCGLACGVDSGEYVFMNPSVYLNCSNGFDEMRDSPGDSEEDEHSDGQCSGGGDDDYDEERSLSYRSLADSIHKFGEIYEKIEKTKRQQMIELEKMRMDFHRELELQKKQIMENVQAEIEKMREDDNREDDDDDETDTDETDVSAENLSG